MSRQINQPINQVRLTNVAVVRMNKGGQRFEIACYRNKAMDYRKGLETDLSEVLQTDRIFTNVSKGQFAKHSDLQKVFGTKNEQAIAQIILSKGQLQVSDLERQSEMENTLAQIATWMAAHCVHPQSQRPYTISQIKHALGKHYQVQPHKPIKKQYLDCFKILKGIIPLERAKMELVLSWSIANTSPDQSNDAQEQLDKLMATEESMSIVREETTKTTVRLVLLADPSLYRTLDDLANSFPQGKLEVLRTVVTQEGDVDLEMEIERKNQLQQKQSPKIAAAAKSDDEEDSVEEDHVVQPIVSKAAGKNHDNDQDNSEAEEEEEEVPAMIPEPQTHKFQSDQKKKMSKKAKRRLKEQEAEREARARAEQERQGERARVEEKIQPVVEANAAAAAVQGGTVQSCNTCGGSFPTAASYRAHFKSDWHKFNQQLKLQGKEPVSEKEFTLCDAESFFGA